MPSAPPPAEVEANLARAQAGDPDALRVLFRTYQPRLLRFLRGLEPGVADDLAGEVWLAVAVRLDRFVGSERDFRAWLFAVARNRLADHRRRAARRPRLVAIDGELVDGPHDQGRSGSGDPAELAIERLSAQAAIDALVADLTPEQAEVVLLRIVGGLSVDEVATLTTRTPGAVRVLQHPRACAAGGSVRLGTRGVASRNTVRARDDLTHVVTPFDPDDDALLDRLLDGELSPEDVPPELAELGALVREAGGPATAAELAGEEQIVAGMTAALPLLVAAEPTGSLLFQRLIRAKVATVVVVVAVGLGAAAAAVGTATDSGGARGEAATTIAAETSVASPTSTTAASTTTTVAGTTTTTPPTTVAATTVPPTPTAPAPPASADPASVAECTAWKAGRQQQPPLPPSDQLKALAGKRSVDDFCDRVLGDERETTGEGRPREGRA